MEARKGPCCCHILVILILFVCPSVDGFLHHSPSAVPGRYFRHHAVSAGTDGVSRTNSWKCRASSTTGDAPAKPERRVVLLVTGTCHAACSILHTYEYHEQIVSAGYRVCIYGLAASVRRVGRL